MATTLAELRKTHVYCQSCGKKMRRKKQGESLYDRKTGEHYAVGEPLWDSWSCPAYSCDEPSSHHHDCVRLTY